MRIKLWWLGFFLVTFATCRLGTWVVDLGRSCGPVTGILSCHHRMLLTDLALMLLPVTMLLVRGLIAGIHQFRTTRRMMKTIRAFPAAPLPPNMVEQIQRLGLVQCLDIVRWDQAEAFCYGFLRPRICITTGLIAVLQPTEVEAVLRHERHHLRQRDPLRVLGWTMLSGACWWLRERAAHADLLRELAADRAVMEEQGRAPLASALLKLLTRPRDAHLRGLAVSGLSVTDARIDQLLTPEQDIPPPSTPLLRRWMFGPLALIVYVVGCSVVMSVML